MRPLSNYKGSFIYSTKPQTKNPYLRPIALLLILISIVLVTVFTITKVIDFCWISLFTIGTALFFFSQNIDQNYGTIELYKNGFIAFGISIHRKGELGNIHRRFYPYELIKEIRPSIKSQNNARGIQIILIIRKSPQFVKIWKYYADVCAIHFFWQGEREKIIEILKKQIQIPWDEIYHDQIINFEDDILKKYYIDCWNRISK